MVCYNRKENKRKWRKQWTEPVFMDLDGTISDRREYKGGGTCAFIMEIKVENLDTTREALWTTASGFFSRIYGFSENRAEAVGKYEEYFSRQGLLRMFCMME